MRRGTWQLVGVVALLVGGWLVRSLCHSPSDDWPAQFTLERSEVAPGEDVVVSLAVPYASTRDPCYPGTRGASSKVTHYLRIDGRTERQGLPAELHRGTEWVLVPGDDRPVLNAPERPGRYEVVLGERSCGSQDVGRHGVPLQVVSDDRSDLEVSLVLESDRVSLGQPVQVSFDAPLSPRVGEYFELALEQASEPVRCVAGRTLYAGAAEASFDTEGRTPGPHEVRLFGRHQGGCGELVVRAPVELVMVAEAEEPAHE